MVDVFAVLNYTLFSEISQGIHYELRTPEHYFLLGQNVWIFWIPLKTFFINAYVIKYSQHYREVVIIF